jgi:DNA replication protein DnaC
MERHDVLEMMTTLKLAGMRAAFDEVLTDGLKRKRPIQRIVGELLEAEIADKRARSIKYQMSVAKLPLARELADFAFADTPVNEPLVRELASGGFLASQRNVVLVGGTGTGKSHLAVAIARTCIRDGARARFFNTVDLVKAASPTRCPAATWSSSTSWATCHSPKQAASCCSISSAGCTNARPSSSPPT